jgi:catechol 2,3-dioxygenase-like lactoylglutathione lyase family enzyme
MSGFVSGVDFVVVATDDIERSEAFYRDVLELEFGKRWGKMPGVEYETGSLTLALMESKAFGMEFQANRVQPIAFRVDDVAERRAQLEAKGVAFRGDILDSGVCHQAFFTDPDGNALILHHRYAE